jgi:hypothetical protein
MSETKRGPSRANARGAGYPGDAVSEPWFGPARRAESVTR